MAEKDWQTALKKLVNGNKWQQMAIIAQMLGRLEAYNPDTLDWFVQSVDREMSE